MSQNLALLICCSLSLALFILDAKRKPRPSPALWIPVVWLAILLSRPVSSWFGFEVSMETADDYMEGSPFDRWVFLFLIAAALVVLTRRRLNWPVFFRNNRWLCIYFAYLGLSIFWS